MIGIRSGSNFDVVAADTPDGEEIWMQENSDGDPHVDNEVVESLWKNLSGTVLL